MNTDLRLAVNAEVTEQGVTIDVLGKQYDISYDAAVWAKTPDVIRDMLKDNLAYGSTQFLPVLLEKSGIDYATAYPMFESQLHRNQIYDMLYCARTDGMPLLGYLKDFYNLTFTFAHRQTRLPELGPAMSVSSSPTAVIPFSFGKESLATFALCRELGIEPILVYTQEPAQSHEDAYKRRLIERFSQRFGVTVHYVTNETGSFRHGRAFPGLRETELGWGSQTTLLTLMMMPFVYAYGASYILFGSEYSNNDIETLDGWNVYCSFDQTSFWTPQQDMMARLLTGGACGVYSMLEPLEEVTIFDLLHHRYPEVGAFQFSCNAINPLVDGTPWCHDCGKCDRNYVFALATGKDPASLGFTSDLLNTAGRFGDYLAKGSDYDRDLDLAFHILSRRNVRSRYVSRFRKSVQPRISPWEWYRDYFTTPKPGYNVPPLIRSSLDEIITHELARFADIIPNV